jgi:hypothetical protein
MVGTAVTERKGRREPKAFKVQLAGVGRKVKRETRDFPGSKEMRAREVRTVEMGATVRKGRRVPTAFPVRLAGVGRKVKRETRAFPGPKEMRARKVKTAEMGVTVRKGRRVPKALPARKGQPVTLAPQEKMGPRDSLVSKARLESPATQVSLGKTA